MRLEQLRRRSLGIEPLESRRVMHGGPVVASETEDLVASEVPSEGPVELAETTTDRSVASPSGLQTHAPTISELNAILSFLNSRAFGSSTSANVTGNGGNDDRDVDGNGMITPLDLLALINELNRATTRSDLSTNAVVADVEAATPFDWLRKLANREEEASEEEPAPLPASLAEHDALFAAWNQQNSNQSAETDNTPFVDEVLTEEFVEQPLSPLPDAAR